MKVKTNRLIAAGILSVTFLAEAYLFLGIFNQFGTSQIYIGHELVLFNWLLLPVFAILIANPVFDRPALRQAVIFGGVLSACTSALLYSAASMLYAIGLGQQSQTIGYYIVAARVLLLLIGLFLAVFEPKKKETAAAPEADAAAPALEEKTDDATDCGCGDASCDCAEATAEEVSNDEAKKADL